ncbi:MAG: nuclear transport factor 2 family protein [Steroidobacteraceae bacterium]
MISIRTLLSTAVLALMMLFAVEVRAAGALEALSHDVSRLESLREVKDLQRSYVHFAQAGRWNEMAALFARDAKFIRGDETVNGGAAIAKWLMRRGGGRQGLAPGALNFELIDEPLANLSGDGKSAKARWMSLALSGDGRGKSRIEGGIYENEYVREGSGWKISVSRYYPQYDGDYETGWQNAGGGELPLIPFHFTLEESGQPLLAAAAISAETDSIDSLERRVAVLNDEDAVRNLQHAYGYYVDRRMWDDVADLFAADATVVIEGVGTFEGKAGVRRAMERMGPAGLKQGQLNDRPLFDTIVRIQPDGRSALTRGLELGMLGEADKGVASWEFSVFRNRFVKEGGVWKLRELRIAPLLKADYASGWGKGGSDNRKNLDFLSPTRATPAKVASRGSDAERLAAIRTSLARSLAWDGSENISSAYGYYVDDFQWPEMAGLFAVKGNKQSPFAGYFIGRDRILGAVNANYGPANGPRTGIAFHWRIQPVINVASDGRSANMRARLLQMQTGKLRSSTSAAAAGFSSGMYPNDQTVLEDGIWKLWSLEIDEHYFTSAGWKGGWSGVKPLTERAPSPRSRLLDKYPPDILMTELGRRAEGFRGGTGETIEWPGILPMWFNYRNPVSGREPSHYLPDCVPCELRPQSRMTRHGYLPPYSGP